MRTYASRARAIQPTGVRKMFDLAGDDVVSFGLGEPDFQPPPVAIEAFHRAMLDGRNKYTTTAGLPALREAIAASWSHVAPGMGAGNVCITMSGTNALLNLFMTLVNPGDKVLLPEPYFPLYGPDATLVGGSAAYYPCRFENAFVPNVEELEALYDRIIFEGSHVSFLGAGYGKVFVVNSFSKTFAMTGWRIGYIVAESLEHMQQVIKVQYYITACPNDAMQYAVLAAMEQAADYPDVLSTEFKARCDLITERLNAMPGVQCHKPKGSIYVFPRVDVPGMSSEEVAMEALADGVLCSPGTAFGPSGEGHLRFAFTIGRDDIVRGMDLFEATLARLRG